MLEKCTAKREKLCTLGHSCYHAPLE